MGMISEILELLPNSAMDLEYFDRDIVANELLSYFRDLVNNMKNNNPHEQLWKKSYGEQCSRERDMMDTWDEFADCLINKLG